MGEPGQAAGVTDGLWTVGNRDVASDLFPDGVFVAGDGGRESFEPSIDWDALPENDTNEAKFDESVINIQSKEPVGVAANSAVDSGPGSKPGFFG